MVRMAKYLAAAAAVGAFAAPAMAQYPAPQPYPQQYPQSYPQQYPQGYPQTGYGYPQQGYSTNPIQGVIDQLLGNRYAVNDRTAVQQCATAAVAQASAQYRPNYNQGYGNRYTQQWGPNYNYSARVTGITNVERRNNGVRVSGTIDSGRYASRASYGASAYGAPAYGAQAYGAQAYGAQAYGAPGYPNQGYGNRAYNGVHADLTFRCNVDYRGAVTNLRVRNNGSFRRPY